MSRHPTWLCAKCVSEKLWQEFWPKADIGTSSINEHFLKMSQHRPNNAILPLEIQLLLGAELRWAFSSWALNVPLKLLRAASMTRAPSKSRPEALPFDGPVAWCRAGVLDQTGQRLFDEAFAETTMELERLDVSRATLAQSISRLIWTECDPYKLKTKAILALSHGEKRNGGPSQGDKS